MRNFRSRYLFTFVLWALSLQFAPCLHAQSLTQGDVSGTVSDPSGAVIPGAHVTIKNADTGAQQTSATNGTGFYHFGLLGPGTYVVTITAANYQNATRTIHVTIGQSTLANVQMAVAAQGESVTVTDEGSVVQATDPSVSTTMSSELIHLTPDGGGDLSYIAQTAPGSAMNAQAGFGNFATFGIPAVANDFTVNSMPENDPFLNLNNSGATNIMLGQNDVSEATVVSNGYSGQYSMAGANVNYVSRSGSNSWHGNASWLWNGRYVNGNNYFNKQNSPATDRPFVNDNQWAASFGGPIKKDKTFFFFDTEGLRLLVPVTTSVNVPTQAWEAAALANVGANQPSEVPLYTNMFNLWNNAPGAKSATNTLTDGGCADFAGTAGFGAGNPCALQYHSAVTGRTHEWLITGRLDQNIGTHDTAFVHFRMDRGLQASYTDPLNPAFNITSSQPQYEGQLQETHNFGPSTINSFSLNGSYYRAIFAQTNLAQALATQPLQVSFTGSALYDLGFDYTFPFPSPQGRTVTQYGFVDDFSHTAGRHNLKFGANLARYDITDYDLGSGSLPAVTNETMTDFFNGVATTFQQNFPARLSEPVSLFNLGFYGEDKFHVKDNLDLTFTLRADRNSNPACSTNCFSMLNASFLSTNHDLNTPYNQTILANQHNALPSSYHPWTVQPRFGFNWSPMKRSSDTVISGGFGLFSSTLPAGFIDNLMTNLPGDPQFILSGLPFGPSTPGNAQGTALAAANTLRSGFSSGATYSALNSTMLSTTGAPFSVPNFFNVAPNVHVPRFQEWDLQIQQGLGSKMALTLKYVGNHGIWEQINDNGLNAYCGSTVAQTAAPGTTPCLTTLGFTGTSFAGLPSAPMDPRFLQVTEASSGYNSNYNGLTVSFVRRLSSFQFQLNYTWSHALDYVSNNGIQNEPFNFGTNASITNPQNPFNVRQNMYGNADYDIRHYFSANYVYTTPKNLMKGFLGGALAGWTVGGNIFLHTGLPFTVIDGTTGGVLNAFGYGTVNAYFGTFADQTSGVGLRCSRSSANPANGPCPALANNFAPDSTGFGNQRRNQVYGPGFFDTDLTISKNLRIPGWEQASLSVGATAYNLFNHPNFDQPDGNVASSTFGSIIHTVSPPTSIYGSFLGADASPRLLQSQIKLTF